MSGFTYNKKCNWTVCPRYTQKFEVDKVLENDFVFLNLDHFEQFVEHLRSNRPRNKFILVTQNSDRDFTQNMFDSIKEFTSKILPINCTFQYDNKIPLGFNDQSTEVLDRKDFTFIEKTNLIYMNFKLHHHSDRPICFNHFSKFDWVIIENGIIPMSDFYDKLNTFKYCISPRGTGIDTHRTYESLLFGVIPIVKKSELDDLYSKFPVIIVDEWSDITHNYLTDNYDTHLSNYFKWKENNKDWYKSDFWIK